MTMAARRKSECKHADRTKSTMFAYYKVDGEPIEIAIELEKMMSFDVTSQLGESYYVVETRVYDTCRECGKLFSWSTVMEPMSLTDARKSGFEFAGDSAFIPWKGKVAVRGQRLIK